MNKKELNGVLDKFVEERQAHWNHSEWLSLTHHVKALGFHITDEELGNLLEEARAKHNAYRYGLRIVSKSKLINLSRSFIKKNKAKYSNETLISFLNHINKIGYFNKNDVHLILQVEKNKFLARKEEQKIKECSDNYSKMQKKDSHEIKALNHKVGNLEKTNTSEKSQIMQLTKENKSLHKNLEELNNNFNDEKEKYHHERQSIAKRENDLLLKETHLNKEKEYVDRTKDDNQNRLKNLQNKEVELKLAQQQISAKEKYLKTLEEKNATLSQKLSVTQEDLKKYKKYSTLYQKKSDLKDEQLKIMHTHLERNTAHAKDIMEKYDRKEELFAQTEDRLKEFGK